MILFSGNLISLRGMKGCELRCFSKEFTSSCRMQITRSFMSIWHLCSTPRDKGLEWIREVVKGNGIRETGNGLRPVNAGTDARTRRQACRRLRALMGLVFVCAVFFGCGDSRARRGVLRHAP